MLPMSNTGKINATNGRQQQQQQQCANLISTTKTTTTTANTNIKGIKKPTTTTTIAAATSSIEHKGNSGKSTTTTTTKLPDSTINNDHNSSNLNANNNNNSNNNNKNISNKISTIPTTIKSHSRADSNAKLQLQQQPQHSQTISCNNITSSSNSTITTTTTNNHNNALQQQQPQQQQQHHLINNNSRRDPHKYQYARPQTLPPSLQQQQQQQQQTNNIIVTTTTKDECDAKDNYLVYYDNELISGKLESLIEHMVPTSDYYPQHNYVFAFLLSARLFLRPYELLAQISQTWERQQQQQQQQQQQLTSTVTISHDVVDEVQKFSNLTTTTLGIGGSTTSASPLILRKTNTSITSTTTTTLANPTTGGSTDIIAVTGDAGICGVAVKRTLTQKSAQNCIRLLSEWIETFPYDFRDERLMQQVRILARKCIYIDTTLGKKVSQILQLLVQRLTALEKYEEFLQSLLTCNDQQQQFSSSSSSASSSQQTYGGSNNFVGNSGITSATSTNNNSAATATIGSLHNKILLQKQHQQQTQQQQQQQHQSQYSLHHSQQFYNQQQNIGGFYKNCNNSSSGSSNNSTDHYQQQQQNQYNFHNQQQQQQSQQLSQHATLPAAINEVSSTNTVLGIMDICSSCAQLAHQLTAIELERLSHIGPEEFVQAFAKEYQHTKNLKTSQHNSGSSSTSSSMQQNNTNSFNDMKKTRNLESYVEWFNRLSYLTATEIVKYSKKKQRVRVIEYWIETARECFNIGNFNSLMAIIAGLNLAPISRLKKTWAKVQSAKFSVLEHQMDPTSNFNSYRSTLKAAMWRFEGATDERERIIIPFFSLFVKDLYFLNEGCSNRLPNNHINFEKCSHLAKQVMDFNEWKQVSCPFEKLPNVISFLQNINVLNENTLSMASFECEPPENTEEKGRYKTVKAETKQQLLQQLQGQQQQQQQH